MREDTYTFKKSKRNDLIQFLWCCMIPIIIMLVAFFFLKNIPDSISDCYYSQGELREKNSYYKTISLKRDLNPTNPDIPCAYYSHSTYFEIGRSDLYDKIDSILKIDTSEHFIQIWYQEHRYMSRGRIGVQHFKEYFQIIVDGTIVLPFNKWEHQQFNVIMMIFGVLLLGLFIKLYLLKRRNSYFIKKYTEEYFKNKEGLSTIANDLSANYLSEYTEFHLVYYKDTDYIFEKKYQYVIDTSCLWRNKYQKVLLNTFGRVGCFQDLVWFHRDQRNRNGYVCSLERCPNPQKHYPNCTIYSGNNYPKDTDTNCMYHIEDDWYIRLP